MLKYIFRFHLVATIMLDDWSSSIRCKTSFELSKQYHRFEFEHVIFLIKILIVKCIVDL